MAVVQTMPVHVLGDDRIHLAQRHLGRLRQGNLKTLCGQLAVSELSPFVLANVHAERCPVCFPDPAEKRIGRVRVKPKKR
jgi:hypothetical protein